MSEDDFDQDGWLARKLPVSGLAKRVPGEVVLDQFVAAAGDLLQGRVIGSSIEPRRVSIRPLDLNSARGGISGWIVTAPNPEHSLRATFHASPQSILAGGLPSGAPARVPTPTRGPRHS